MVVKGNAGKWGVYELVAVHRGCGAFEPLRDGRLSGRANLVFLNVVKIWRVTGLLVPRAVPFRRLGKGQIVRLKIEFISICPAHPHVTALISRS